MIPWWVAGLKESDTKVSASFAWTTMEPFLHLYCAMCTDRARKAVHRKDDTKDRQAMEARRHDNCPITFYEIVAEDFNNDDIRFTTQAVSELSYKFAHPSDLYFHDMPGGAITTDDVKS